MTPRSPESVFKGAYHSTRETNPMIRKLSTVVDLTDDDVAALGDLCRTTREVKPHHDLIVDGDRPDYVILILSGWACRYKILPNGSRQITAFMLPGDFCDIHVMILTQMDHSIAALTGVKMTFISREQFHRLTVDRPTILRALWWSTLVDEGVLRAWIVNNGRRSARERVAHLICELHMRASSIRLGDDDENFRLPITQIEIADAVGMTPVHVNRVIGQFVAQGIVTMERGKTIVLDVAALERIAEFDPSYLHAQRLRAPDQENGRP